LGLAGVKKFAARPALRALRPMPVAQKKAGLSGLGFPAERRRVAIRALSARRPVQ